MIPEVCVCHRRLAMQVPQPSGTESVAVNREGRIDKPGQHLRDRLLDQAIHHGRNAELPHAAPGLGILCSRTVCG